MSTSKRLSPAQRRVLEDVERTGNPWARVFGQSAHGGMNGTMRVLTRERWIRFRGRRWLLTRQGKVRLARDRRAGP